eukprot:Tbor_TRINITY_DN1691_c1_g1::TRINITY_DN1691_c1_g1_i1::g.7617::m.7617
MLDSFYSPVRTSATNTHNQPRLTPIYKHDNDEYDKGDTEISGSTLEHYNPDLTPVRPTNCRKQPKLTPIYNDKDDEYNYNYVMEEEPSGVATVSDIFLNLSCTRDEYSTCATPEKTYPSDQTHELFISLPNDTEIKNHYNKFINESISENNPSDKTVHVRVSGCCTSFGFYRVFRVFAGIFIVFISIAYPIVLYLLYRRISTLHSEMLM